MNVCGVTFVGYLAKKLSFKLGNLLYKSNFYLLSEDTVSWWKRVRAFLPCNNRSKYVLQTCTFVCMGRKIVIFLWPRQIKSQNSVKGTQVGDLVILRYIPIFYV